MLTEHGRGSGRRQRPDAKSKWQSSREHGADPRLRHWVKNRGAVRVVEQIIDASHPFGANATGLKCLFGRKVGELPRPLAQVPVDFVVTLLAAEDRCESFRRCPAIFADDPPEGAPLFSSAHAKRAPLIRASAAIDALGRKACRSVAQARRILASAGARQEQWRDHRDAALELA